MRLIPKSMKWRAILLTLFGMVSTVVTLSIFHGAAICWEVSRHYGNFQLRSDDDPLIRALARGVIHPGSDIEEVIKKYPPKSVVRRGEFVEVNYPDPADGGGYVRGPSIVAVGGRVVMARVRENWLCEHFPGHTFLDTRTRSQKGRYCILFNRDWP